MPSFSDSTNEFTLWVGNIIIGDKEHAVKMVVELFRLKSSEHTLGYRGKEKPDSMYIWIRKTPEFFKAKRLKLSNAQEVLFKENSKAFSQFRVNGAVFSAAVDDGKEYSKLSVMQSGKAKLYIINDSGVLYADFDMHAYRIYRADDFIIVEQLQVITAVYSIIQHLLECCGETSGLICGAVHFCSVGSVRA
ncbi:MAG: hypothetical protein LBK43_09740 [Treponema sp.]|nr:hypothetical protein [Treponema sp.]